ncbi:MAG TPA: glycosyltransferase family 87 protein [Rhizobiaceae bacterium]|nr:glycosyltransferase family 87 protein [Rhizobiaceae bacterium]
MPTTSYLSPFQKRLALVIGLATIGVGIWLQFQLWQLDALGVSIKGERLPYWDFTNLWSGSRMVLEGHARLLFDPDAYRAQIDHYFNVILPDQEWSYPPGILLIGVPLALLPIWAAFLVWSLGTVALWHLAIRPFNLPAIAHLFVLLSPAIWSNQMFGQNGALTAALLIAGLYHAPARPILAGFLIGALTIKPHLGILIPFCLLASRNWTAFASAAATALGMAGLTGMLFGFDVWSGFLTETRALMTLIMEAPYPQAYHTHMATFFVLLRSLGAGLELAYAMQACVTVLAIVAAAMLWLPQNAMDHRSRVALTGVLVIIATPYGYTHDTAPLYLAIVWFLLRDPDPRISVYAAAWLFALLFPAAHGVGIAIGVLGPLVLAVFLYSRFGPLRADTGEAYNRLSATSSTK